MKEKYKIRFAKEVVFSLKIALYSFLFVLIFYFASAYIHDGFISLSYRSKLEKALLTKDQKKLKDIHDSIINLGKKNNSLSREKFFSNWSTEQISYDDIETDDGIKLSTNQLNFYLNYRKLKSSEPETFSDWERDSYEGEGNGIYDSNLLNSNRIMYTKVNYDKTLDNIIKNSFGNNAIDYCLFLYLKLVLIIIVARYTFYIFRKSTNWVMEYSKKDI